MKTAISIPDETFERADERAKSMGISRSEFFSRAAERYLRQLDDESLTARVNEVVALVGTDESTRDAIAAGRRYLSQIDDEW